MSWLDRYAGMGRGDFRAPASDLAKAFLGGARSLASMGAFTPPVGAQVKEEEKQKLTPGVQTPAAAAPAAAAPAKNFGLPGERVGTVLGPGGPVGAMPYPVRGKAFGGAETAPSGNGAPQGVASAPTSIPPSRPQDAWNPKLSPGVGFEQDTMWQGSHRPYTGVPEWAETQLGRRMTGRPSPGVQGGAMPAGYDVAQGFWPGDAPGAKAYPGMAQYRAPNVPSGVNEMRGGQLSYGGQPTFSPDEYAKILAAQAAQTTAGAQKTESEATARQRKAEAQIMEGANTPAGMARQDIAAKVPPGTTQSAVEQAEIPLGMRSWKKEQGFPSLHGMAEANKIDFRSPAGKEMMRKIIANAGSNFSEQWGSIINPWFASAKQAQEQRRILQSAFADIYGEPE